MIPNGKILVVEDDSAIAAGLATNLRLEGYDVAVARDGDIVLEMVAHEKPTLLLLDLGLPKKDGVTVLAELRASGIDLPVIVLSARDGEVDKVGALRLGADDYVTKPFALAELLARVEAVMRRATAKGTEVASTARFGTVVVDLDARTVTIAGQSVMLTRLEYELLQFFIAHPGHVHSRYEIMREVWGTGGSQRTVDNFVSQLRAKLETDPENPRHLLTVRGSGYRFVPG